MDKIQNIISRQIFDSRGNPTVETDVITNNGVLGRAAVPSGASTGAHEAYELRDNGKKYHGKSVLKAVSNVNGEIFDSITGFNVSDQIKIDETLIKLDGKKNKSRIGANSILSVSLSCAVAAAKSQKIPLFRYLGGTKKFKMPTPMLNVINGGAHANNNLSFQEFMIVPVKAESFNNAMQIGTEIFHNLKKILNDRGLSTSVGDEGGFAPNLEGTEDALKTIISAIGQSGYKSGEEVMIALDCASSEFYKDGLYDYSIFEGANGKKLNSNEQADYLSELSSKYPIISIEDGMDENDWDGWKYLTKICGDRVQLVGDDLFVTNSERLNRGIKEEIGNSILIKVNQIGTLTETIDAVKIAQKAGFTTVMSHRSGETEDSTIADLAVALSTGQIKTGSASRSDRMSKYNQLLRIEEALGKKAYYPKKDAFNIIF